MTNPESDHSNELSDRFATGFNSSTGELFVYGALVVAAVGVAASLIRGEPGFFAASAVGIISAFYFYPFLNTKHAQLGANSRGLYVAGLGLFGWNSIEDILVVHIAVRTVEKSELRVTFNCPIEKALLVPDEVGPWRAFMARHWSVRGDGVLRVRLEHLRASSEQIDSELTRLRQG